MIRIPPLMKKALTEQTVIFISVVKWVLLAYRCRNSDRRCPRRYSSRRSTGALAPPRTYRYYFLAMPLGLLISALIIKHVLPGAKGHGANQVIDSIHRTSGKIKPVAIVAEFVRSFVTLTSGGSAGKEGPSAQIGAGLASLIADLLKFTGQRQEKARHLRHKRRLRLCLRDAACRSDLRHGGPIRRLHPLRRPAAIVRCRDNKLPGLFMAGPYLFLQPHNLHPGLHRSVFHKGHGRRGLFRPLLCAARRNIEGRQDTLGRDKSPSRSKSHNCRAARSSA